MPEEKKPELGSVREDGQPKLGMKFENSRDKLLHFKSSRDNPALKESMINQVKLHEGEGAANELRKEVNSKYDQERNIKPKMDFIHNPNGKLQSRGIDLGKPKTFTWCEDCGTRCYIFTIIKDNLGNSISRCCRCGTDCLDLNEEQLKLKQEEGNARKNT